MLGSSSSITNSKTLLLYPKTTTTTKRSRTVCMCNSSCDAPFNRCAICSVHRALSRVLITSNSINSIACMLHAYPFACVVHQKRHHMLYIWWCTLCAHCVHCCAPCDGATKQRTLFSRPEKGFEMHTKVHAHQFAANWIMDRSSNWVNIEYRIAQSYYSTDKKMNRIRMKNIQKRTASSVYLLVRVRWPCYISLCQQSVFDPCLSNRSIFSLRYVCVIIKASVIFFVREIRCVVLLCIYFGVGKLLTQIKCSPHHAKTRANMLSTHTFRRMCKSESHHY